MKKTILFLAVILFTASWLLGQALDEDFESGTWLPTDWTQQQIGDPAGWSESTAQSHSTSHSAFHNDDDVSTGCNDWLITPVMDLSSYTTPQLTYWEHVNYGSWADEHNVLYSTDYSGSGDPTAAIWTLLNGAIGAEDTWVEIGPYTLPTSATVYITFQYTGDNDAEWWIDDVTVAEAQECTDPSDQTESNILKNSASLGWTENGSATSWDIELGATGFSPSGTPTATGVTNPYTYGSLNANTTYDWYVRANCGGIFSNWIGASTFTTVGDTVTTFPWTETFTTWPPYYWDLTGGTFDWVQYTATPCAEASFNNWSELYYALMSSPPLDVSGLTSPELLFDWSHLYHISYPLDELDVLVSDNNGSTWTSVWNKSGADLESGDGASYTYPGSFVTSGVIDLSPFGTILLIRFNGISGNGTDLFVDNIIVRDAPPCPDPTEQTESGIIANSANLGWTENGTATTWEIEWMETGVAQGCGTIDTVTTNPYHLTGLSATTTYDWYVRAGFGGGYSNWVGASTFTTPCVSVTAYPWIENFDASQTTPNCWTNNSTDVWNFGTFSSFGASQDHTTGSGNFAWVDDSPPYFNPSNLDTPPLDITSLTTPILSFWYWIGENTTGSTLYIDVFNGTSWTEGVDSYAPHYGWIEATVDISAYSSIATQIRFRAMENPNYCNCDICVDDVTVAEIPGCAAPSDLSNANVTSYSADLFWTENGTATNWNIEFGPTGFSQGSGTIITGITTNPYHLSGLSAETIYDWFVRADCAACGGTGQSIWAGPNTLCNVHTLPIVQGFNAMTIPSCWADTIVADPGTDPVLTYVTFGYPPYCAPDEGTHLVQFNSYFCPNAEIRLESPEFSTSGMTSARVLFAWYESSEYSSYLDQGVTVQWSLDGSVWNNGTFYQRYNGISGWYDKIFNLPAGALEQSCVYIGFLFHAAQYGENCFLDDVIIEETPPCSDPSDQTETNITSSSAVLGWIENGIATTWEIEWMETGIAQGSGIIDTVTANPYTLDSLSVSTAYDWYIRADCGEGSYTNWIGPSTFATICAAIIAPFNEPFTDYSLPNCWLESGPENWNFSTNASYGAAAAGDHTHGGGTQYAWVDGTYPYSNGITLETPLIDPTGLTTPQFSFWYFSNNTNNPGDNNNTLYCNMSIDGGGWTNIFTYTGDNPNWQIFTHDLSSYTITTTVQFRFIVDETVYPAAYNDILIDDVIIAEIPSCPDPITQTEIIITPSSAILGWTEYGTATTWEIEWMETGVAQGSGIIDTVTANPYTLDSLLVSTTYDWYIRANCGCGDYSNWVGPHTFTTACVAITSFPATEDFENFGTIPNCWTDDPDNTESWQYGTYAPWAASEDHTSGSGYLAWIDDESPHNAFPSNLLSPYYNTTSLTSPQLLFYYWIGRGQVGSTLDIDVYDGNTWQTGLLSLSAQNGWLEAILNLTPYSNANLRIRFSANEKLIYYGCDISIDDITVQEAPSCPYPTVQTEINITTTSADLGWTENGTATTWEIEWMETGVAQGSGTTITGITANPYTLNPPLTENTTYDWYVRADCGCGVYSNWVGPSTFITACDVITSFPTTEDFENAGTIPNCWTDDPANTESWQYGTYAPWAASEDHTSGSGYLAWIDDGSPHNAFPSNLLSPIYNTTSLTSPQLLFYYWIGRGTVGSTLDIDVYDGSTWQTGLLSLSSQNGWLEAILNLTPYSNANLRIRFSANEQISYYSCDISIDDITVREAPACPYPTAQTETNITTTSADLGWSENGTATTWEIEWMETGVAQGSGTTITGITANPYTLNPPLTANTTYDWYVRADCGCGEYSNWVGPGTFKTQCYVYPLPIVEGFNQAIIPDCWSETIVADPGFDVALTYVTSGTYPTCSPNEGTHMVKFNSNNCLSGSEIRLESPEFSTAGMTEARVLFAWYESSEYSSRLDEGVTLQWCLDDSVWNDGTFYQRYNATSGWYDKTFNLPAGALGQSSVYVGFLFHSQFGCNCYLDDVEIKEFIDAPTNVQITNNGTNVTITWDAVTGAATYNVYSSTDPYGTFTEDTTGSLTDTQWVAPSPAVDTFYYVTADNTPPAVMLNKGIRKVRKR